MARKKDVIRILGGEARGRAIAAPPGRETRPILARLKDRLFNILGQRLDGAVVWDFFAGSGALGLEAVSRGAAMAVFLESDPKVCRLIEGNLRELGFADRGRVVRADVMAFEIALVGGAAPDLVFFDPPYPMFKDAAEVLIDRLAGSIAPLAAPGATIVMRAPTGVAVPLPAPGLSVTDDREHGANRMIFLEATPF